MICPNCGNQNNIGSKFCIRCGKSLEESNQHTFIEPNNQQPVEPTINQPVNEVQNSIYEQMNQNTNAYQQPIGPTINQPVNEVQNSIYEQMNQNTNAYQQPVEPTINQPVNEVQNSIYEQVNQNTNAYQQPIQNSNSEQFIQSNINNSNPSDISFVNYFLIILEIILKPFTTFKEKLNKFEDFKNSIMVTLIVSVIATIVTLLKTMITTVKVTSYLTGNTEWMWENLKNINYIKVIGINLLIYLGIIFVIAGVYYIESLIAKKQSNFSRLLGISALSVVPAIICSSILAPIFSMIYIQLGVVITIIGIVYTVIIIYEIMNNEILLEGNAKIYFNLICLSILFIALYYLCMKIMMGSVTNGVDNILNQYGF